MAQKISERHRWANSCNGRSCNETEVRLIQMRATTLIWWVESEESNLRATLDKRLIVCWIVYLLNFIARFSVCLSLKYKTMGLIKPGAPAAQNSLSCHHEASGKTTFTVNVEVVEAVCLSRTYGRWIEYLKCIESDVVHSKVHFSITYMRFQNCKKFLK